MRLFPKGKLPLYESDYTPSGWFFMRPAWYRSANNHILLGDTGVGKTTLMSRGLHELASMDIYEEDDLKELPRPRKTLTISRFSLERHGFIDCVDSWIDIDGERFTQAFAPGGNYQGKEKAFESILSRVNVMVMTLSAQQILELQRLDTVDGSGSRIAEEFLNGMQQRMNHLFPGFMKKILRAGYSWQLVITQCGDVLHNKKNAEELNNALVYFADRTGFRKFARRAILCDSIPESAEALGVRVAKLRLGPRGGLYVGEHPDASVCSAGVAMGIMLGRVKVSSTQHPFVIQF